MPAKKSVKLFSGTTRIDSWKFNGVSEENIENITKSDSNFAPTFFYHQVLQDIKFNGHCLINNIYVPREATNIYIYIYIYISYKLNLWLRNLITDFTLINCLFESVKLTKNNDPDKYKYSIHGIGFDSRSEFSFTDGCMGKMSLLLELI